METQAQLKFQLLASCFWPCLHGLRPPSPARTFAYYMLKACEPTCRPHSEAGLGFLFLFLPFFPLPHSPFFLKGLVRFLPSSATTLCASPLSSRSPAMSPAPIRAISEPPQIAAPSPSLPDRGGRSPGARFQPALSSQRSFIPGSTTPRRFSSLRHCPPERSPLFSLWPNVRKETPAPLPPLSFPQQELSGRIEEPATGRNIPPPRGLEKCRWTLIDSMNPRAL